MTKIFLLAMLGFGLTLMASGYIIWQSVTDLDEVALEREILATRTAETRDQPNHGGQATSTNNQDTSIPVDLAERTPGLRQLLREGKLNPLIYDDGKP